MLGAPGRAVCVFGPFVNFGTRLCLLILFHPRCSVYYRVPGPHFVGDLIGA